MAVVTIVAPAVVVVLVVVRDETTSQQVLGLLGKDTAVVPLVVLILAVVEAVLAELVQTALAVKQAATAA